MYLLNGKHRDSLEFFLHLIISMLSVYLLLIFLPTMLPLYKFLFVGALVFILMLDGYFLLRKQRNFLKINRMVIFYLGAILLLVLAIFYITKMVVFTDMYGFEGLLKEHLNAAKYIFFIISFAQPILLPIPEAVTVPGASAVFGPFAAAAIAFVGTTLGIAAMFFATRYGRSKIISKLVKEDQLKKYQNYVSKNETLIMFILFLVPILPDEIICVGAGLGQVSPKRFLMVASVSKLITATLLAYSFQMAEMLSITGSQLMIAFSVIIILLFGITFLTKKLLNKERLFS